MTDQSVLSGERVLLRPAAAGDVPRLAAILATPEVSRWWGPAPAPETLRRDLADEEAEHFVIAVDGAIAGMIQYAEEEDPQYRSAGMDIFLAPEYQGRGLGTDAIRTLARYLLVDRGHHRLTIDPAADNARAIASYRKLGFRAVGIMRQYERGPDGSWHDGLLMDLLRTEFIDPRPPSR